MQPQLHTQTSGCVRVPGNERTLPMAGKSKNIQVEVGRDAKTGEFVSVKEAERRPNTTVVETIKRPRNTRGD
jgi:hypothetical protein